MIQNAQNGKGKFWCVVLNILELNKFMFQII